MKFLSVFILFFLPFFIPSGQAQNPDYQLVSELYKTGILRAVKFDPAKYGEVPEARQKQLEPVAEKMKTGKGLCLFTGTNTSIKEAGMSASWVGKQVRRKVQYVDLARLTEKYIGETEKNLSVLFDLAEKGKWILFFDEADALFGKRTNVSDSHDRYANLEVSYFLEQISKHEVPVFIRVEQEYPALKKLNPLSLSIPAR